MQCLAKEPGSRPATAQAVRTELEEIVMPSGDYTPSRLLPRQKRSNRAVPIGAGVLVVAAAMWLISDQRVASREQGDGDQRSANSEQQETSEQRLRPDSAGPAPASTITGSGGNAPAVTSTAGAGKEESSGAGQGVAMGAAKTATAPRAGATRSRTATDSIADLVLLLRAQAPPDPIVRRPQPNEVSQAALEERRNNPGPRRSAVVFADTNALSRTMAERIGRALDQSRYTVTISDRAIGMANQGVLDTLAMGGNHDIVIATQAVMRRDSSYTGIVRLRDLTAHAAYATSGSSRRIPTDSVQVNVDSLAAVTARRLTQMDRAPRAGVVDPEVRAFEERAATLGPPRRLVIWNHPPHDNLDVQEGGSAVMDVLRTAVRSQPRFVQVTRDSTLGLLARSRNRETVMNALKADLMVSISGSTSSRMDSVSWTISVRDLGAASQYQERSFRSAPAPIGDPLAISAITVSRVLAALEQMDAAPRRR
jgi:hypothetical protein